jgi:uncharacterized protein (UPF0335 family)
MSELHTETLLRYVDRIEEAAAEVRAAKDVEKGVYAEAKEAGFQPKLLRQVIRERAMDPQVRIDLYRILGDYRTALGLYADTPLGEAAMRAMAAVAAREDQAFARGDRSSADIVEMPRAFADQPVHQDRRRGRPRKVTAREAAEDLLGA